MKFALAVLAAVLVASPVLAGQIAYRIAREYTYFVRRLMGVVR